ncbi:MAG TPA: hypothetical protein VFE46_03880, partial [Pirellulales bacterium]|nr:hypothetical protein [Pirellulales bacterium]
MTLNELIELIENSSANHWDKFEYPTVHSWDHGSRREDGQMHPYIEPNAHTMLAVYAEDIDITLAYGGTKKEEFSEPWTERFSDPSASSVSVTAQYRGQPVHQWTFVTVDGGKFMVPLPQRDDDGFYIDGRQLPMANLMFGLWGHGGAHKTL